MKTPMIVKGARQVAKIIEKAKKTPDVYMIVEKGEPRVVVLSITEYENMVDLIDTMSEQLDNGFQKSLKKSMGEYKAGEVVAFEELEEMVK